jgi:hypothetical protein
MLYLSLSLSLRHTHTHKSTLPPHARTEISPPSSTARGGSMRAFPCSSRQYRLYCWLYCARCCQHALGLCESEHAASHAAFRRTRAGWLVQQYESWRSCWYNRTNTDAASAFRRTRAACAAYFAGVFRAKHRQHALGVRAPQPTYTCVALGSVSRPQPPASSRASAPPSSSRAAKDSFGARARHSSSPLCLRCMRP